jgi:hypothetical protein
MATPRMSIEWHPQSVSVLTTRQWTTHARHLYHHRLQYLRALLIENDGCIGWKWRIATCCGVVPSHPMQHRYDVAVRRPIESAAWSFVMARMQRLVLDNAASQHVPSGGVACVVFALAACGTSSPRIEVAVPRIDRGRKPGVKKRCACWRS